MVVMSVRGVVQRLAVAALSLLLASACTFNRFQLNEPGLPAMASSVVPGRTTLAELEEMLGGPATSITPIGDRRLYVWTYGESKTAGLTLLLLNISKTNMAVDTALFLVDSRNVVEYMDLGKNTEKVSWQWWAFGD